MPTQELNRLGTTKSALGPSIQEHIAYLDEQIEKIKQPIAGHIEGSPELKSKRDKLHSIPGIGLATITAILAEIALISQPLIPLTPFMCAQSGTKKGST
jgi:transposase